MRNALIIGTLSVALLQTVFAQKEEGSTNIVWHLVTPTIPGDIAVNIPDINPTPLSAEEREKFQKMQQVEVALPYGCSLFASYTLGQMVKECDRIVIGRISRIEAQRGVGWFGMKRDPSKRSLTIGVETNLFGSGKRSFFQDIDEWESRDWSPKQEKRAFIFLENKSWDKRSVNTRRFDFDKENAKTSSHEKSLILYGDLGAIEFDDAETEKAYLAAMDGYLKHLRERDRDSEAYYEFLLKLAQSPIERIRDDAITDLMWFLHYAPSPELKRRLEDKRLDERLKDYVRVFVLPYRGEEVP
jgi:hypothetical protein